MNIHTYHPDSHTHGLADECPRCAEHAEHPIVSLDDTNLTTLIRKVIREDEPRSENEAKAMDKIEKALWNAGKLTEVDPLGVGTYLLKRWRVRVETPVPVGERTLREEYLWDADGDELQAAVALAKNLIQGDGVTLKAGYSLENAAIASAEVFGLDPEAVQRILEEES